MFELQTILLFLLASGALALAPGPDNIFVLTQSALYGRLSGWWVTLGLCTGLLLHSALAAAGIAAALKASACAYTALKIAGACYLLYLAWGAYSAAPVVPSTRADAGAAQPPREPVVGARAMYVRGLIMNITNPKVAIFFLAFLPGFADAGNGPIVGRMLVLGGYFIGVTLLVFATVAWAAGFVSEWLQQSAQGQIVINRVAAGIFVGLAVHLLMAW